MRVDLPCGADLRRFHDEGDALQISRPEDRTPRRVLVSFGETWSFPRKREPTPQTFGNVLSSEWIPAFAGMTGGSSGFPSQMTPAHTAAAGSGRNTQVVRRNPCSSRQHDPRQDFEIILVQHGPRPQKIAGHKEIAARERQAPQTRLGERVFAVSIIGNTQEPQSYKTRPAIKIGGP